MKDFEVGEKVEFWVDEYYRPTRECVGDQLVFGEVIQIDTFDDSLLVEMSHGGSLWFDQPSLREMDCAYFHNPSYLRRIDSPQEPTTKEQPAPTPNKERTNMKLYKIVFDSTRDFVEASSFSKAIELWRKDLVDSGVYCEEDAPSIEPESVELISGDPVIRGEP